MDCRGYAKKNEKIYIMTRFFVLLVFMLFIIDKSIRSSLISKSVCSSNSSTFICQDLQMNVEDFDFRRVRSDFSKTKAVAATDKNLKLQLPKESRKLEESLDHLRAILERNAFSVENSNNNYLIKSNLNALYKYHPCIDHVNHIYSAGTLFHNAVFSANFNLIEILSTYEHFNPNVLDENGFSALEIACDQQDNLMISFLIITFKSCLMHPFQDFVSILHYAAANGRLDLLLMIKDTEIFDFTSLESAKYGLSPLELALFKEQYAVAEFLIDIKACYRPKTIKYLYLKALANFEANQNLPIFLVFHFRNLIYVKNLYSDKDFDLNITGLAIKYKKISVLNDLNKYGLNLERS